MFGKIVIVNNELMKNKGTPESQTFKKKQKQKKKNDVFLVEVRINRTKMLSCFSSINSNFDF